MRVLVPYLSSRVTSVDGVERLAAAGHVSTKQPTTIIIFPLNKLVIAVRFWCGDNENDDDMRAVGGECPWLKGNLKKVSAVIGCAFFQKEA